MGRKNKGSEYKFPDSVIRPWSGAQVSLKVDMVRFPKKGQKLELGGRLSDENGRFQGMMSLTLWKPLMKNHGQGPESSD